MTAIAAPGRQRIRSGAGDLPAILVVSLAALAVLTAVWWWATTSRVSGLGTVLTEAGRLTGLASGAAVCALVLLAARIGPLDRAIGSERLYLWHSRLGRYAVIMIIAHTVLITAGYVMILHDTLGGVIWSFLTDPMMLLAVIATLALLVVGVVSMVALRHKFSYETWQAIHLVTYAAIILGLLHEVTNGAQFAGYPVITTLWILASVGPVVVLLVNRLVRPMIMNARQGFRVKSVTREAPGVYSLVISGKNLAAIPAVAGQYVRVHANAPGLRFASNPYSFSAVPDSRGWRITFAVVGEQSRLLAGLAPGTRLWLEGPLGGLTLDQTGTRPVLLIASGTGVAPMRALAESALVRRHFAPVVVFYRAKDGRALFGPEWAKLANWAKGRLAVHVRTGSRAEPANQITAANLTKAAPWIGQADVLVCGAPALGEAVRDVIRTTGAASLRVESFGW